ncbi:delta(3,5)-Delta(2,4)-dienoyl-CoA isomerase, mitochondrial-like [Limulus polyphemus]|uniref:Delta(3,5)-Delta(2,4)-dienoyl-CoA isomerase, mitochondrial-like n=1 Tax=Limulus polyphemus TaxID=6850 RepID=A0ABM1BBS9_LIMPO|nr:delta(3,5)-Delta(2,4)-dienoyl-CoA isomerase, mitochondrial-like [Limulus polyphemus]
MVANVICGLMGRLAVRRAPILRIESLAGAVPNRKFSEKATYTMSYETLDITSPHKHILHVQLNRPEKLNAMNKVFWREILDCFREISDDTDIRAVILTGAGRMFSAGLDIQDMNDLLTSQFSKKSDVARRAKYLQSLIGLYQESFNAVEKCQKPVISAIHGGCIGSGVDLIAACDIRYCTQDAWFQVKEVDLGFAPDLGTLQKVPKGVGNNSMVREMIYTARKVEAGEAKGMGLVSRVFPNKEAMMSEVDRLAESIASKSPVAVQGCKVALNYSRDHTVSEGLKFMQCWNMTMLQSEDVIKGSEAVAKREKKPPHFSKL